MTRVKKSKSINRHIFIPIFLLFLGTIIIFTGTILWGGVPAQLKQNSRDILQERVNSRKTFLQNEMVGVWSNIDELADRINSTAQGLRDDNVIDITQLDRGSDFSDALTSAIAKDMISSLRNLKVTGIFVVYNNHNLDEGIDAKPGLYIRDLDPSMNPIASDTDLLIERGSSNVIKQLNIATASSWAQRFEFEETGEYYSFLYNPYQQALEHPEYEISDLGYWSPSYHLLNDDKEALAYSLPLIDDLGNVYGTLGVEISSEYMERLIPESEINDSNGGSYCLAVYNEQEDSYQIAYTDGIVEIPRFFKLETRDSGTYLADTQESTYVAMTPLKLYSTNGPYEADEWALMAIIRDRDLQQFANRLIWIIMLAVILTILTGIFGSFYISYRLSSPIVALSKQVQKHKGTQAYSLQKTDITEIDQLVSSIEDLNSGLLNSALRFNRIIELSSVQLAAYELNKTTSEFFITSNFFDVFQYKGSMALPVSVEEFKAQMKLIEKYIVKQEEDRILYHMPAGRKFLYIELHIVDVEEDRQIGVAEDVTERMLEQGLIEYERDHDMLTGLLSRRAFHRESISLFQNKKEQLKKAALLMMDLDNLKYVNDTYGHDVGDTYIVKAAQVFTAYTPKDTLVARISGDEFNLLFYGYESEEDIQTQIERLKAGIEETYVMVGGNQKYPVRVSGGIAWYPKDSDSLEKLQVYADYAMYAVKRSNKGRFESFNLHQYEMQNHLNQNKQELELLIREELLQYYFQPIVSVKTGEIYGYEALMRSMAPSLRNPEDILSLAREENRLQDIEILTLFKAMESYVDNLKKGFISPEAYIFINSIASQEMPVEKEKELENKYWKYLSKLVLEITEEEKVVVQVQLNKNKRLDRMGGQIALDDYGSGYNSGKMLLEMNPKYVKIDMEIIRGLDRDMDKQTFVANTVSYAHERNMMIVAEGIETVDELKAAIRLDVDLLQGYLLAKPQYIPPSISQDLTRLIVSLHKRK